MQAHIRVTIFVFVLFGALAIVTAIVAPRLSATAAATLATSGEDGADLGAELIAWTGRALAITAAILAPPSLLCAWGLRRRRNWARWLGIFLGALAIVQVPVGTFLGAYVLWVLLSERFEPWFEPPESPAPPATAPDAPSASEDEPPRA